MAEAFALLGLLSNIFQFIEQGGKVLANAKEMYESSQGVTLEMKDLHRLLEDIQHSSQDIQQLPLGSLSDDERAIRDYSAECDIIVAQLHTLIKGLTVRDGVKPGLVASLRISVRRMTKQGEMQRLVKRLKDLDERLRIRLQRVLDKEASANYKQAFSSVIAMLDSLDRSNQSLGIVARVDFDDLRNYILLKERKSTDEEISTLIKSTGDRLSVLVNSINESISKLVQSTNGKLSIIGSSTVKELLLLQRPTYKTATSPHVKSSREKISNLIDSTNDSVDLFIKSTNEAIATMIKSTSSQIESTFVQSTDERISALLNSTRDGIESLVETINERLTSFIETTKQALRDFVTSLDRELSTLVDFTVGKMSALSESTDAGLLDLNQSTQKGLMVLAKSTGTHRSMLVRELAEKSRRAAAHQELLRSLLFPEIKQRYSQIKDAHRETFKWAFNPSRSTFPYWLESEGGIYWVSGLAGSGKSTLMKYVFDHERTNHLLKNWAEGRKLVTASFFFWNQGTMMQKSQFGLFQSLLFQILRSDDSLALELCPGRDNMEPWTSREITEVFRLIPQLTNVGTRFCFFIDGLDEYDGEEEDILSTIEWLTHCSFIKICASSRPWNTFRRAFQDSENQLAVEDLTKVDIKKYIKSELEECGEGFASDAKCKYITEKVSQRAHGVFLWVYLVVRGLKRDLRSDESLEHLSKRVDELPPDLNEYFRIIFDKIDPIYRQETARLFLVQLYWSRCTTLLPLPVLAYHGLKSEMRDPDYALKEIISTVSSELERGIALGTMKSEQEISVTRINDRGRDLLKALPLEAEGEKLFLIHRICISFLHRTVKDFLEENYVAILQDSADGFVPARSICRIFLSILKNYPVTESYPPSVTHPNQLMLNLYHISSQFFLVLGQKEEEIDFDLIDEFTKTIASLHGEIWIDMTLTKSMADYGPTSSHGISSKFLAMPYTLKLVILAVFLELPLYLKHLWQPEMIPRFAEYQISPLEVLLEQRHFSLPDREWKSDTLKTLLELGCDPNAVGVGFSFLSGIGHGNDWAFGKTSDDEFRAAKLMFQHGMDLDDHGRSSSEFEMSTLEGFFGASRVNELLTIHNELRPCNAITSPDEVATQDDGAVHDNPNKGGTWFSAVTALFRLPMAVSPRTRM